MLAPVIEVGPMFFQGLIWLTASVICISLVLPDEDTGDRGRFVAVFFACVLVTMLLTYKLGGYCLVNQCTLGG